MYSQLAPELFGFFLANIPLAVAMLDRQMSYLFTSCRWLSDYGSENQSIIGRSHYELFPKISSKWQDIQQRCLLGSVEQCEKDCWTRADGKTIWVKWQLQPWRDETHEIGGLILSTEVLSPTQPLIETNAQTVETTSIARYKDNFVAHQGECTNEAKITQQHWDNEAGRAAMTAALQKLQPEISQFKTKRQHYQEHIEALVTERTWKLAQVNEQLQAQLTERTQVEGALRKQLAAMEVAMDGIAVLNQEGEYLYLNKAHVQLFGYSSATELLGKTWREIYYPDEIQQIENEIFPSLMQNGRWHGEATAKKLDGSTFPQEVSLTLIDGEGLICVCRDITTRKLAEEALRRSEAGFRRLAQREAILNVLANQIRNSLDLKTIQQTLVDEIRELLQLDRCCITWYYPHLNPPTWDVVTEAKAANLPTHVGCYPATNLSPIAQKLLQMEIIRADSVEMIGDSVLRESLQSVGYSALLALPTQTEAGEVFIVSCVQCGTPRHWAEDEVELLKAIIDNLAIAINHAELYEKTRVKAQELEQALYELQRTQTQLVQSEKMSSLGQLMAGVAHEINNPVSFIYGNVGYASDYIKDFFQFLELYRTTYPNSTPEIRSFAEEIDLDFLIEDLPKLLDSMKIGATRIREIVRSLGTFSRIDQAEYKLIDLHEGLDNTLLILEHRLKATAAHPRIEVIKEYSHLPLVECYGGQLNQVFMNLLTNAIDAMNEVFKQQVASHTEEPCIQPTIIITTQVVDSNQVSITIADNGHGISSEVLPRLFDPFFTTKPVGKGTGLGLAISYQIIAEKHGGSLRCNSLPGGGTEFVIELPIKQV